MQADTRHTIRSLQQCTDLVEFKDTLVAFRKALGFAHFLYGVRLPSSFSTISHFIVSDYPEDWLQEYTQNNYAEFDPVVHHCVSSHEPYCWDRLLAETEPRVVKFTEATIRHGLVGGVCVGIQGHGGDNGIFCLGGPEPLISGSEAEMAAVISINTVLPYVHSTVLRLASFRQVEANQRPALTERELEVLLWSAEGKTTDDIAAILSVSSPTVTFHIKNAIQKLNVSNRSQAAAKAVLLGIIKPQYASPATPRTYLF